MERVRCLWDQGSDLKGRLSVLWVRRILEAVGLGSSVVLAMRMCGKLCCCVVVLLCCCSVRGDLCLEGKWRLGGEEGS